MKKTFLFIMCGVMALTLVTGCGNEKEEKSSNNEQVETNKEENKKNQEKIEIKTGARYTWSSDSVGIQIDLQKDNEVTYSSRTRSGSYDEYYGNFSIKDNELVITLTEMYSDNGNVPYNDTKTYKLISDTEFNDKDNNVYSFKTMLDK